MSETTGEREHPAGEPGTGRPARAEPDEQGVRRAPSDPADPPADPAEPLNPA